MPRATIRARLTIWYGLVMVLTLVGLGSAVYMQVARSSLDRVDAMLDFEFREAVERLVDSEPAWALAAGPATFHESYLLRVEDRRGRVVAESTRLGGHRLPAPAEGDQAGTGGHVSARIGPLGLCRIVSGTTTAPDGELIVTIATPLDAWEAELAELRWALLAILPAGLLAATCGGYWLAASALAPIARIAEAARRVSAENLGERLLAPNPEDELGKLAATLNAMLDRIDRGFAAARRFTADAAHELRTPVASIRAEAEVALLAPRTAEEYQLALGSIVEESARLARLSDRLLTLSREDAGAVSDRSPVRLDLLVRQAIADAEERARGSGLSLRLEVPPEVVVQGDADGLRQVLDNLLHNALKYTPPGGTIDLRVRSAPAGAVVEVADSGEGISPEILPRVFDRFFCADPSRSRRTGGAGLGLSIARAVVERHGGAIEAESRRGVGSVFRVVLPARPDPIH
jgi:heavy metal sensor kinase